MRIHATQTVPLSFAQTGYYALLPMTAYLFYSYLQHDARADKNTIAALNKRRGTLAGTMLGIALCSTISLALKK